MNHITLSVAAGKSFMFDGDSILLYCTWHSEEGHLARNVNKT